MSRNYCDATCLNCGDPIWWLTGSPQLCQACLDGKKKNKQPEPTFSLCGGSWICGECHLTFLWDNFRTQAAYQVGSDPVIRKQIGGKTKPEKCPRCGHKEIDSV